MLAVGALSALVWYLLGANIAVLEPQGLISQKQRQLMIIAASLSLIVVIPVFVMLFGFSWRYRESNKKAKYDPKFDHSRWLETIWWGIPTIIIVILAVITWRSSYELHPSESIRSDKPPLTIQVVALQWKWLFIYPGQNIASVNFVQFPEDTPIDFAITADAPMNSFWIPQLGGQIYAMSGMSTHLHLMADSTGSFRGSSANISGEGFALMNFEAKATTQSDFDNWVQMTKLGSGYLNLDTYTKLAQPSKDQSLAYYGWAETGLYNKIVAKYMAPQDLIPAGYIQ